MTSVLRFWRVGGRASMLYRKLIAFSFASLAAISLGDETLYRSLAGSLKASSEGAGVVAGRKLPSVRD